MKLKLRSTESPNYKKIKETILERRGINDVNEWMLGDYSDSHFFDYELLANEIVLNDAILALLNSVYSNKLIALCIDCDVDGYTSSAILVNYLYERFQFDNWQFLFHRGKEHGLSDLIGSIDSQASLVILPDAGTNDIIQHKQLNDRGIPVICLDHHIIEEASPYAFVINNQSSNLSKAMTGAGVTWLFCLAIERQIRDTPWDQGYTTYPEKWLDLVALGNLSDMADYRDSFVRTVVNIGLKNINNRFLQAMCDKNKYSIDKMGGINYMSIAFYVTPYMNAVCRTGTMDEKRMMFDALLDYKNNTTVPSVRRNIKNKPVPIWDETVYMVGKAKERQTAIQNAGLEYIEDIITSKNLNENAVIVACCDPDEIDPAVCGLIANKLQSKYQKPAMVLREIDGVYKGSARNYSMSEIEDMKSLCESSGLFEFCAGHEGAFGLSLTEDNLKPFVEYANNTYQNISTEPTYWIDYMLVNYDFHGTVARNVVGTIAQMKEYWGQQIPEAKVGVRLLVKNPELIGKDSAHRAIKMNVNGVDIIKFKSSDEEYAKWIEDTDEDKFIVAYCTCAINEYSGVQTPQLIIEDYYLETEWIF